MRFYISTGGDGWLDSCIRRYERNLIDRGHEAVYGGRHADRPPRFETYNADLGQLCASDYLVVVKDPAHPDIHPDQGLEIGYAVALEIPILAVGPVMGPMCLASKRFHDWIDFLNSPLVKVKRQTPDMAAALLDQIRRED